MIFFIPSLKIQWKLSVLIYHKSSFCQPDLIPDLFIVDLPVLPQSGGEGHVLDPRGFSCLYEDNRWHSTLPGHDVRKTQGWPQKRQEHRDLLVEVYHWVWPKATGILSMPQPWFSRAQNCSLVAHHTRMFSVLGKKFGRHPHTKNYNPLWYHQHPRGAEFIDDKCDQGSKTVLISMKKCKEVMRFYEGNVQSFFKEALQWFSIVFWGLTTDTF